jgi:hypothetical protein
MNKSDQVLSAPSSAGQGTAVTTMIVVVVINHARCYQPSLLLTIIVVDNHCS